MGAAGNRKERSRFFFNICDFYICESRTLLLAHVKWFSIPLIHMLDATRTQTARERARATESERERESGLHASFRVGHRAVTAITKNNMQHSQSGLQKPSRHSQLFKYSGKTILILSATASGANITSYFIFLSAVIPDRVDVS